MAMVSRDFFSTQWARSRGTMSRDKVVQLHKHLVCKGMNTTAFIASRFLPNPPCRDLHVGR